MVGLGQSLMGPRDDDMERVPRALIDSFSRHLLCMQKLESSLS